MKQNNDIVALATDHGSKTMGTLIKDILNFVSNVLKTEKKVDVTTTFNLSGKSFTDGTSYTISIPHICYDKSYEECLIMMRALCCHEAAHGCFSDFSLIERMHNFARTLFLDHGMSPRAGAKFAMWVHNVLEDKRVNTLIVSILRGMSGYIKVLEKEIHLSNHVQEDDSYVTVLGKQLIVYTSTGFDAEGLENSEHLQRVSNAMDSIKHLIEVATSTSNATLCCSATEDIMRLLVDDLKEEWNDDPSSLEDSMFDEESDYLPGCENELSEQTSEILDSLQSTSSEESGDVQDDSKPSSSGGDEVSSEENDSSQNTSEESVGGSTNGSHGENNSDSKSIEEYISDEEQEKMQEEIKDMQKRIEKMEKQSSSSIDTKTNGDLSRDELLPLVDYTDVNYSHCVSSPSPYSPEAKRLGKKISNKFPEPPSKRIGLTQGNRITASRIHLAAAVPQPTIFESNSAQTRSVCIQGLIDGSGSTDSKLSATKTISDVMIDTMSGLEFLCSHLKIPCKIAQYNTSWVSGSDSKVNHTIIKGFEEKSSHSFVEGARKILEPNGANCDSVNIEIATKELSKRSEAHKILIVVTDGEPSVASGMNIPTSVSLELRKKYPELNGDSAMLAVTNAVKNAKKSGVTVIGVFIADEDTQKNKESKFRAMYGKNSVFATPTDFPQKMSVCLSKILV